MPGENIQDWSPSATLNGNSDSSINFAEGQPRASVNNSARSMMAAHAKDRNLKNGSIVTAGAADAQTFFSGLDYTTVPTGLRVMLKIGPDLTNTTTATLNMDNIGAVAIKTLYAADLVAGEVVSDTYAEFVYNGTNWILLGISRAKIEELTRNVPAFSAYRSSVQFPVFDTWTKLVLDAELFDTDAAFDNVTNFRFTPLRAGTYFFNGSVNASTGGGGNYIGVGIYKNGGEIARSVSSSIGNGTLGTAVLTLMNSTTDYVELYGLSSNPATPQFVGGLQTSLQGYRVY